MYWEIKEPRQRGWYLVTVECRNGELYVLPLFRSEYPNGNFYWRDFNSSLGDAVIACVPFPEPYPYVKESSVYGADGVLLKWSVANNKKMDW